MPSLLKSANNWRPEAVIGNPLSPSTGFRKISQFTEFVEKPENTVPTRAKEINNFFIFIVFLWRGLFLFLYR